MKNQFLSLDYFIYTSELLLWVFFVEFSFNHSTVHFLIHSMKQLIPHQSNLDAIHYHSPAVFINKVPVFLRVSSLLCTCSDIITIMVVQCTSTCTYDKTWLMAIVRTC